MEWSLWCNSTLIRKTKFNAFSQMWKKLFFQATLKQYDQKNLKFERNFSSQKLSWWIKQKTLIIQTKDSKSSDQIGIGRKFSFSWVTFDVDVLTGNPTDVTDLLVKTSGWSAKTIEIRAHRNERNEKIGNVWTRRKITVKCNKNHLTSLQRQLKQRREEKKTTQMTWNILWLWRHGADVHWFVCCEWNCECTLLEFNSTKCSF